ELLAADRLPDLASLLDIGLRVDRLTGASDHCGGNRRHDAMYLTPDPQQDCKGNEQQDAEACPQPTIRVHAHSPQLRRMLHMRRCSRPDLGQASRTSGDRSVVCCARRLSDATQRTTSAGESLSGDSAVMMLERSDGECSDDARAR